MPNISSLLHRAVGHAGPAQGDGRHRAQRRQRVDRGLPPPTGRAALRRDADGRRHRSPDAARRTASTCSASPAASTTCSRRARSARKPAARRPTLTSATMERTEGIFGEPSEQRDRQPAAGVLGRVDRRRQQPRRARGTHRAAAGDATRWPTRCTGPHRRSPVGAGHRRSPAWPTSRSTPTTSPRRSPTSTRRSSARPRPPTT